MFTRCRGATVRELLPTSAQQQTIPFRHSFRASLVWLGTSCTTEDPLWHGADSIFAWLNYPREIYYRPEERHLRSTCLLSSVNSGWVGLCGAEDKLPERGGSREARVGQTLPDVRLVCCTKSCVISASEHLWGITDDRSSRDAVTFVVFLPFSVMILPFMFEGFF